MASSRLEVAREDELLVATVNRPEARNALDRETWAALVDLMDDLAKDDRTRVVIITGAGDKSFVSGADVALLRDRSMVQTLSGENRLILDRWEQLAQITIAAVNGYALGAGCELALACDLIIASSTAKFGLPEVGLGFLPGAGGTQRLTRLVGLGKAKELILKGDIIDSAEALRIGLVNEIVQPDELLRHSRDVASKILKRAPLATRIAKIVLNQGASTDIQAGMTIERLAQTVLFASEDRIEGVNSFLEKREPKYTGR